MIMKAAKLLALLYLSSSASADTCTIIQCATSVGAACGATNLQSSPITVTACTGTNQYCNSTGVTGTCANQLSNGASCTSSGQCTSNYCRQDGVCAASDVANNGACKYSADCDSQNCVNSVCTGAGAGQSCTQDANCNAAYGLYCGSSNTCVATVTLNSACSATTQECADGLYCSAAGKCTTLFTLASGASCVDTSQCGDGLTCVGAGTSSGTCQSQPASSGTSCKSDNDCSKANEACSCNYATGAGTCQTVYTANPSGASSIGSGFSSCYSGSCSGTQNINCYQNKCTSNFCSAAKVYQTAANAAQNNLPSCARSAATLPSQCSSATAVTASAVAAVAVVAALMM